MTARKTIPLFSLSLLSLAIATNVVQAQTGAGAQPVDEIVVTGFRKSLNDATLAKRESVNVTDSVFAEDIGKFPDLNIAESLNRIPGVQLTREVNGEGLNVAIRGLGTNFTKITLNGSQIGVASSGRVDSQSQNREVDLDLFPTELFTRLDVSKSPVASSIEGGIAGTVNMRSARPFDNPGTHFTYQLQGSYGEISEDFSPRAAFTGSWTSDDDVFGVLVGVAGVDNKTTTRGFETIGWTNPNLTWAQCGLTPPDGETPITNPAGACNASGGNGWVIPANVPAGVANGLTEGAPIDRAFLEAANPGVSIDQLGEALIPRLGRPAYIDGSRKRISGLVSLEYRPSDSMHFYLDTLWADADREFNRIDMNWIGRNGSAIPLGLELDSNNVVTRGTFANAQFFLEARPYDEQVDFYNINPGAHLEIGANLQIDFQLNKSRSEFLRESPTILVNTPLGQGITVEYDNSGGDFPSIATNIDLNDPNAGWTWEGGRLNIANEERVAETEGAHLDLRFGDDRQNIRFGLAYDEISRVIISRDNSPRWEDVACRNGLDANGDSPEVDRQPCTGLHPNSAIPQSALASYLRAGPDGFVTVDFDRFMADSNYAELSRTAPEVNTAPTGANSGGVSEETLGAYIEINSESEFMGRTLRTNAGMRYVTTDQVISGPVEIGDVRTTQELKSDYDAFLPSFNAALNLTDDIVLRVSGSRTLTRANPSSMLPNTTFSDPSAQSANQGNPNLSPYMGTNFDIGGEWYTGDEGYVGLTIFNKQISGFTVLGTNDIPFLDLGIPFDSLFPTQQVAINSRGGPEVATVTVSQQVNASGVLDLNGFELTWVQPLDMLIEGFGFQANYTNIHQSGKGEGVPAQAIGVSPKTYNVTGYWENFGASVRLSYVWNDEQISSGPNQNGLPLAQLYTDARGQWDLSASYQFENLPTAPQLTLNVINITSEPQRSSFWHDNATFTYYDPGYSVLVGVRGTF